MLRVHKHAQNLNEDREGHVKGSMFWRGRGWWTLYREVTVEKGGQRYQDDRAVIAFSAEWSWRRSSFGLGFEVGEDGDSEAALKWHVLFGPFSFWLGTSMPRRWRSYDDRVFFRAEIARFDGRLIVQAGVLYDPWGSGGRRLYLTGQRLLTLLLGRETCETVKEEQGTVEVPMTEGSYTAKLTRETREWRRPRWPWPIHRRLGYWLDFDPKGIPYPGKGENSWDCGMDGLFGIGGETPEKAIGNAVAEVLRTRKQRGWSPEMLKEA